MGLSLPALSPQSKWAVPSPESQVSIPPPPLPGSFPADSHLRLYLIPGTPTVSQATVSGLYHIIKPMMLCVTTLSVGVVVVGLLTWGLLFYGRCCATVLALSGSDDGPVGGVATGGGTLTWSWDGITVDALDVCADTRGRSGDLPNSDGPASAVWGVMVVGDEHEDPSTPNVAAEDSVSPEDPSTRSGTDMASISALGSSCPTGTDMASLSALESSGLFGTDLTSLPAPGPSTPDVASEDSVSVQGSSSPHLAAKDSACAQDPCSPSVADMYSVSAQDPSTHSARGSSSHTGIDLELVGIGLVALPLPCALVFSLLFRRKPRRVYRKVCLGHLGWRVGSGRRPWRFRGKRRRWCQYAVLPVAGWVGGNTCSSVDIMSLHVCWWLLRTRVANSKTFCVIWRTTRIISELIESVLCLMWLTVDVIWKATRLICSMNVTVVCLMWNAIKLMCRLTVGMAFLMWDMWGVPIGRLAFVASFVRADSEFPLYFETLVWQVSALVTAASAIVVTRLSTSVWVGYDNKSASSESTPAPRLQSDPITVQTTTVTVVCTDSLAVTDMRAAGLRTDLDPVFNKTSYIEQSTTLSVSGDGAPAGQHSETVGVANKTAATLQTDSADFSVSKPVSAPVIDTVEVSKGDTTLATETVVESKPRPDLATDATQLLSELKQPYRGLALAVSSLVMRCVKEYIDALDDNTVTLGISDPSETDCSFTSRVKSLLDNHHVVETDIVAAAVLTSIKPFYTLYSQLGASLVWPRAGDASSPATHSVTSGEAPYGATVKCAILPGVSTQDGVVAGKSLVVLAPTGTVAGSALEGREGVVSAAVLSPECDVDRDVSHGLSDTVCDADETVSAPLPSRPKVRAVDTLVSESLFAAVSNHPQCSRDSHCVLSSAPTRTSVLVSGRMPSSPTVEGNKETLPVSAVGLDVSLAPTVPQRDLATTPVLAPSAVGTSPSSSGVHGVWVSSKTDKTPTTSPADRGHAAGRVSASPSEQTVLDGASLSDSNMTVSGSVSGIPPLGSCWKPLRTFLTCAFLIMLPREMLCIDTQLPWALNNVSLLNGTGIDVTGLNTTVTSSVILLGGVLFMTLRCAYLAICPSSPTLFSDPLLTVTGEGVLSSTGDQSVPVETESCSIQITVTGCGRAPELVDVDPSTTVRALLSEIQAEGMCLYFNGVLILGDKVIDSVLSDGNSVDIRPCLCGGMEPTTSASTEELYYCIHYLSTGKVDGPYLVDEWVGHIRDILAIPKVKHALATSPSPGSLGVYESVENGETPRFRPCSSPSLAALRWSLTEARDMKPELSSYESLQSVFPKAVLAVCVEAATSDSGGEGHPKGGTLEARSSQQSSVLLSPDTPSSTADWAALLPGDDMRRFIRQKRREFDSPTDLGLRGGAVTENARKAWKKLNARLAAFAALEKKSRKRGKRQKREKVTEVMVDEAFACAIFNDKTVKHLGLKSLNSSVVAVLLNSKPDGVDFITGSGKPTPFNIVSVREAKASLGLLSDEDLAQCLRYLLVIAGCQPQREFVHGLVYNRTEVCFLQLVLDRENEKSLLNYSRVQLTPSRTRGYVSAAHYGMQFLWEWANMSPERHGYVSTERTLVNGEDLVVSEMLGQGSSSIVYKCTYSPEDQSAVMTHVVKRSIRLHENLDQEVLALAAVSEQQRDKRIFTLAVVDTYVYRGHVYDVVLSPYVRVSKYMSKKKLTLLLALEYLDGIEAFHKAEIVIRDIRRENLLVGCDPSDAANPKVLHAFVTDLNYSKCFNRSDGYIGPYKGTQMYASEFVLTQLSDEVDDVHVRRADDLCSFVRTVYDRCNPGDTTVRVLRARSAGSYLNWISDWKTVLNNGVWGEMEGAAVAGNIVELRAALRRLFARGQGR
ncbi:hypothetical protein KIPB_008163 [Kipferlia bialata]|uniref:Protein kinase domain-containing protein n=1 Tax=Kipferlia bialata TaxID=797122 RepID=A0A391NXE4_9EUKA|nr:hypothetical protein KIPB_008163 [Kipferlia bialata]|eukprot:g8163.t1